jgi:hypothetical protein
MYSPAERLAASQEGLYPVKLVKALWWGAKRNVLNLYVVKIQNFRLSIMDSSRK